MRFRNREERERYMDSLERQMEHQREQIERTLDQTKGSGRLRTAREKLRSSLPGLPGRSSSVRDAREREAATERADSEASRPWWRRVFGG
jgi:septal ring factor EnvC (AmiA/AmiB activator)